MGWKWASGGDFVSFTPTATSTATNYDVDRMSLIGAHPYIRGWRSTVVTETDIVCDIGIDTAITHLVLLNINVASIDLHWKSASGNYAAVAGSPFTVSQRRPGPFYHIIVDAAVTARYIRIRFNNATARTDNAAYYRLGALVIIDDMNTLTQHPLAGMRGQLDRDYIRSGQDISAVGPFRLTYNYNLNVKNANVNEMYEIAELGEETPVLIYENEGSNQDVGLFRYEGGFPFTRNSLTVEMTPRFVEMA